MQEIIKKLQAVEREASREKGEFLLFALILQEFSSNRWDLVLSAFWFPTKRRPAIDYMNRLLQQHLTKDELILISRISLLDPLDPFVLNVQSAFHVHQQNIHLQRCRINNVEIEDAYIITSRNPNQP